MITRRLIGFLAATLCLLIVVGIASNAEDIEVGQIDGATATRATTSTGTDSLPEESASQPTGQVDTRNAELPQWFVWIVGAVAGIGVLWFLTRQRISLLLKRRQLSGATITSSLSEEEQADAIAEFASDLIDELELGGEPRDAICNAYAAVETGFGTRELRAKAAETPLKYLNRVFGRRQEAAPALTRLTDLFQLARFSTEPVDESMRIDAIDALREIRDQYQLIGRARVRR